MYLRNTLIICAAAFACFCIASRATADGGSDQAGQTAPAASQLQVTGTVKLFTIQADHADVLSALMAVFGQAGKQFDADKSVGGSITLRLEGQPLDTALASICKQALIKYHVDGASGIYHFEQDSEAVSALIAHVASLNNALRQQLRDLGLDLPSDARFDAALAAKSTNSPAFGQRGAGQIGGGGQAGGLGGGGGPSSAPGPQGAAASPSGTLPAQAADGLDKGSRSKSSGAPGGQVANGVADQTKGQQASRNRSSQYRDKILDTGNVPQYLVEQLLQAYGSNLQEQPGQALDQAYSNYLRQNGLVSINTKGMAIPVSDLIAELSKQSGKQIMLDPHVPRGSKFRMTLNLPPCNLNDALNLILPPARLKWLMINGSVLITPTPDFQLFYGSAPMPYVIYGNGQQSGNAIRNSGQQGGGQGGQSPPQ